MKYVFTPKTVWVRPNDILVKSLKTAARFKNGGNSPIILNQKLVLVYLRNAMVLCLDISANAISALWHNSRKRW